MSQSDNKIIQHVYETVTSLDSGVELKLKKRNDGHEGSHTFKEGHDIIAELDLVKDNESGFTDYESIGHEVKHLFDFQMGLTTRKQDIHGIALDEYRTVNFENLLRKDEGRPLRKEYEGFPIPLKEKNFYNLEKRLNNENHKHIIHVLLLL